jgi:two-component system sensor histidine kinase KdpD
MNPASTSPEMSSAWVRERPSRLESYVLALALIVVATGIGFVWSEMIGARNLSLLFLGGVLFTGVWLGMRPALFAALLAFISYNFFIVEPRFTIHVAPADVLALAAFLVVAMLVGGLAGRLSDRALAARDSLRNVTSLFAASRDLSSALNRVQVAERLVAHLRSGGCDAGVWLEHSGKLQLAAMSSDDVSLLKGLDDLGDRVGSPAWADEVGDSRWLLRWQSGRHVLGVVAIWSGPGASGVLPDRQWLEALLELGVVAIDRARLAEEIAEAHVVAEKEGLRTALLSSLSHDLRTPISTILASASSLQEHDGTFDAATRMDLLSTIQDDAERLNRYVSNLLEMTRLESGALVVRRALIDPDEAMASALGRLERMLPRHRVSRQFSANGNRIDVDPVLLEQALVNVVENAIVHAPATSTITARTKTESGSVLLEVEDRGTGIPAGDIERVFERFFRGRSDRRSPAAGVGLGLSVTRGLVEAFGGTVYAVSPAADGRGACIVIRLPACPALETAE